jgi:hypothetical protein
MSIKYTYVTFTPATKGDFMSDFKLGDGPKIGSRVFFDHGSQGSPLGDRITGDGDTISAAPLAQIMAEGIPGQNELQPVNQATMECLRGPCKHLWCITSRFESGLDRINIARTRQCNCHQESVPLNDENIYHCDQWWPSPFEWVPLSLRAVMRPKLRLAWEWVLKRRGYDFTWKHWQDDVFEAEDSERRKSVGVNKKKKKEQAKEETNRPTIQDAASYASAQSSKQSDGLYFP